MRVALTGGTASPGIYDVVQILGKDETVERPRGMPSGYEELTVVQIKEAAPDTFGRPGVRCSPSG